MVHAFSSKVTVFQRIHLFSHVSDFESFTNLIQSLIYSCVITFILLDMNGCTGILKGVSDRESRTRMHYAVRGKTIFIITKKDVCLNISK